MSTALFSKSRTAKQRVSYDLGGRDESIGVEISSTRQLDVQIRYFTGQLLLGVGFSDLGAVFSQTKSYHALPGTAPTRLTFGVRVPGGVRKKTDSFFFFYLLWHNSSSFQRHNSLRIGFTIGTILHLPNFPRQFLRVFKRYFTHVLLTQFPESSVALFFRFFYQFSGVVK